MGSRPVCATVMVFFPMRYWVQQSFIEHGRVCVCVCVCVYRDFVDRFIHRFCPGLTPL